MSIVNPTLFEKRVYGPVVTRYTLPIRCELKSIGGGGIRLQDSIDAHDSLQSKSFWKEWLQCILLDGLEDEYGTSVQWEKEGPTIEDLSIEFETAGIYKKRKWSLSVVWSSIHVDTQHLQKSIQWRIGKQMCYYGIFQEADGWHCLLRPGILTHTPLDRQGV